MRLFLDLESVIQCICSPSKLFVSLTFMSVLSSSFIDKALERTDQGHPCGIALKFIYMPSLGYLFNQFLFRLLCNNNRTGIVFLFLGTVSCLPQPITKDS